MTPEEITTVLKGAAEAFPALGSRQPEDEDIVAIREALVPILLRIPYDNTAVTPIQKHNLSGLIQRKTVYKNGRSNKAPFPAFVALGITIRTYVNPARGLSRDHGVRNAEPQNWRPRGDKSQ